MVNASPASPAEKVFPSTVRTAMPHLFWKEDAVRHLEINRQ